MTFYRRNLPHWHPEGSTIFLTWRLFGSLPSSILKNHTARNGCATNPSALKNSARKEFRCLDSLLDRSTTGPMWLKDARVAGAVLETIHKGASSLGYFDLHAYVIMPNHVHLLLTPSLSLARITNGIKGASARHAKTLLKLTQTHFWQDESFDHWVRSAQEFDRIRSYIESNPVSAGLVNSLRDWPWSSASRSIDAFHPKDMTNPARRS
jgi:putative transposase